MGNAGIAHCNTLLSALEEYSPVGKRLHFLCNHGFWVEMLKINNLVVTVANPGVVALVFLDMLRGNATSLAFRTLLQTSPQSASSAQLQHPHFFLFFLSTVPPMTLLLCSFIYIFYS